MRGAGPQVKHLAGGRRFVSRSTLALRMVETTIYTIDSPEPEAPRVPQVGDRIRTRGVEEEYWWADQEGTLVGPYEHGTWDWKVQLDREDTMPFPLLTDEFDLL